MSTPPVDYRHIGDIAMSSDAALSLDALFQKRFGHMLSEYGQDLQNQNSSGMQDFRG